MIYDLTPLSSTDKAYEPGYIFHSGYAYVLKGIGEAINFKIEPYEAGVHKLILRARTDNGGKNTGRTYKLLIGGQEIPLKYREGTATEIIKDIFGGAAWGEYEGVSNLKDGLNDVIIQTNQSYGGFDFIQIIPEKEPRLYSENDLKKPEMSTFISKLLGLKTKEELEEAVRKAQEEVRKEYANHLSPQQVEQRIIERTKGLLTPEEHNRLLQEALKNNYTPAQLEAKIKEAIAAKERELALKEKELTDVKASIPVLVNNAIDAKRPTIIAETKASMKKSLIDFIQSL